MPIISEEDYLSHYGRKGMKWYQHIFGEVQSHAKYAKEKVKEHYQPEKVYNRKSNRINKKISSLDKKRAKNEENASKIDEEIFKLNKKLKKRSTGLGLLLYDSEKSESLMELMEATKYQKDMFLTEAMRYSNLIDKQYDKLDKLNIKYGKELVDRKLRK